MTTRKIILFFVLFLLFNIFVSYYSNVIPHNGNFPYQENFQYSPLPQFLNAFASFDGMMYVRIAHQNYSQYEQAFFPVYPLLIRFFTVNSYTNYYLLTGLLLSIFYLFIGLLIFKNYTHAILQSKTKTLWVFIFLLTFPTSFFFQAVYTESIFFFFTIATFYFIFRKNFIPAMICAYIAALTRFMGVFLCIPFLIAAFPEIKKNWKFLLGAFAPLLGFSTYAFYLWKTTHDALFFFHSQPVFGANRSTHLIFLPQVIYRYIKIFFTSQFNFQLFLAVAEFSIFMMVFGVLIWELTKILKIKDKDLFASRLSINIFSFINLLLPTLTGTFSSIPRYALLSLSFFIALAEIKNRFTKIFLSILFLFFHIIFLAYFIQGYFIS